MKKTKKEKEKRSVDAERAKRAGVKSSRGVELVLVQAQGHRPTGQAERTGTRHKHKLCAQAQRQAGGRAEQRGTGRGPRVGQPGRAHTGELHRGADSRSSAVVAREQEPSWSRAGRHHKSQARKTTARSQPHASHKCAIDHASQRSEYV